MKAKFLRGVSAVITATGVVSAAASYAGLLPPQYQAIGVGVSLGAIALKDALIALGDRVDDGQANGSFKG
jgi:hypothetical protein